MAVPYLKDKKNRFVFPICWVLEEAFDYFLMKNMFLRNNIAAIASKVSARECSMQVKVTKLVVE